MNKEKYVKPEMEVVELLDELFLAGSPKGSMTEEEINQAAEP